MSKVTTKSFFAMSSVAFAFKWTLYFLTLFVCLANSVHGLDDGCPFPPVPFGATYINVTGGLGEDSWQIKYNCDGGYELFGEDVHECQRGEWKGELPHCAVNVALGKPATSSSSAGSAKPGNGVDGRTSNVHEGNKCTETEKEKSPWWTVDLLSDYAVKHVRITTRCCDDVPIKKAEIRVGNSTTPGNNQLCNWIPKAIEEGATETLDCSDAVVGRYVSIVMTGVETVLSLCEVEVFVSDQLSLAACSSRLPPDESAVFEDSCFHFLPQEVSGFDEAEEKCKRDGGDNFHLMGELNEAKVSFVASRLEKELEGDKNNLMTWIGAQRETNFGQEKWAWVKGGSVEEIEWGRGQPNNYNQEQNCAVLDSELDWEWNDISCKISAMAVCEGTPSRCPSPAVGEGTYQTGSNDVGKTVTHHCPVGDMPVGEPVQTCLPTGRWSGEPISCKKVDCGQVPGLVDGEIHVLDGRTTWGARVQYKCKRDHTLMEGDEERRCEENGWSGRAPKCVFNKCPEPEPVDNAQVRRQEGKNGMDDAEGAKIYYSCEEGHKASGSLTRECRLGGKWSGSVPRCRFIDCGSPPAIESGNFELLDSRTSFDSEVQYTCGSDFQLSGTDKRRCEANGKWSRNAVSCEKIQCPPPRAPNGGRVSGYNTDIHSTIEFSCLSGHILEGEKVSTCTRSGQWSSPPPICRFVDCGAVPPIKDGTAHYVNGSTHLGSLARYTCQRSHNLGGENQRECMENGRWSGDDPTCSEIRCSLPPRPNNTIVSVSSTERLHGTSVIRSKLSKNVSYRVGSTLKYRCERGFILDAVNGRNARVATRRCTTSGTWTGTEPSCEFIDCGQPETPDYAIINLQNEGTYYGSMAFYKCEPHFNLDGFERRRCESDGQWRPEAPNCTETLCKPLDNIEDGSMILTTLRIGGRATFSCSQGFALKGDDDIECLSSGSWSSWPPKCVEIDCGAPDKIDNGRLFLVNQTTKIGGTVEYHCFPGFDRTGPFVRTCLEDGYWSGREPSCAKPRPILRDPITILSDNTIDGTKNVRAGSNAVADEESSSAGTWIGVVLGLIVVIGLLVLGLYFYRKQRAITSKPPPYRDRNANGLTASSSVGGVGGVNGANGLPGGPAGYTAAGVYPVAGAAMGGQNGRILARPPPPIQMYSMDEGGNDDARGPIYDTINDDSSGSGYSQSNGSGSAMTAGAAQPQKAGYPSTFSPSHPPGGHPARANNGYSHDYDVPEGSESGRPAKVTINGIAV